MSDAPRSGLVTLAGRPNVGKSTLVNALVGEKVSIVTPKPQTTRHRIVGVHTEPGLQIGFVDTPGMHSGQRHALNRVMNETAAASLAGIDAALFVIEADRWQADDERTLSRLVSAGVPVGLVINKVDRLADRSRLLPFIGEVSARHEFAFVVPLSALKQENLGPLLSELRPLLPEGPFLFPEDEYTDRSLRFMAAETVREKLMLTLQQELPYSITVSIESFEEQPEGLQIHAVIWVARESHKGMVIGRGGQLLKQVGREARLELARRLDTAVDLRLWVKLRERWHDSEATVRELGH